MSDPISRHCAHCDSAVPANARFCIECGTPAGTQAQPQINAAIGTRCRGCGVANPGGADFCVHCGAALRAVAPVGYAPRPVAPAFAGSGNGLVQQVYLTHATPAPIPLIVRALWFVFVGLWLGQLWLITGWLLSLTLVGLPAGVWMLNRTGHVMTLRQTPPNNPAPLAQSSVSLLVRGIYFVLFGWWASLIWLLFGWFAAATVIGLPVAFLMFERTGTVATLAEG